MVIFIWFSTSRTNTGAKIKKRKVTNATNAIQPPLLHFFSGEVVERLPGFSVGGVFGGGFAGFTVGGINVGVADVVGSAFGVVALRGGDPGGAILADGGGAGLG